MKHPLSPAFLRSFERLGRLVGREGLEKLQRAKVAIVGLGGVGSWAAEAAVSPPDAPQAARERSIAAGRRSAGHRLMQIPPCQMPGT